MSEDADARTAAAAAFPQLSTREREVLDLIARGLDNRAIAGRLVLAEKTIRNNVSSILTKLQVADRNNAIIAAREAGFRLERGLTVGMKLYGAKRASQERD